MNRSAEIGKKLTEKFDIFYCFFWFWFLTHIHTLSYTYLIHSPLLPYSHTLTNTLTHTHICAYVKKEGKKQVGDGTEVKK